MFQTAGAGAAAAERPDHGQQGDQQTEDEHQAGGLGLGQPGQGPGPAPAHLGLARQPQPPLAPGHRQGPPALVSSLERSGLYDAVTTIRSFSTSSTFVATVVKVRPSKPVKSSICDKLSGEDFYLSKSVLFSYVVVT